MSRKTFFAIVSGVLISLLCVHAARSAEPGFIIESALHTPPPGYVIEKTFGLAFAAEFERMQVFSAPEIYRITAKTSSKMVEGVAGLGGNAILAETLTLQAPFDNGWFNVYCVVTGEVVLLSRLE